MGRDTKFDADGDFPSVTRGGNGPVEFGNVLVENGCPISRMTIGSLDDMGYQVNYAEADPFSGADMNPSCRCDYNKRMLRSSSSSRRSRRRLSSRGKEEATSFGLEQLEQMNHEIVSRNESALLANQLVVYSVEIRRRPG